MRTLTRWGLNELNLHRVWLKVYEDNKRAIRSYEKAGFRWKRVWNDPNMGPSWFMIAERGQA